MINFILGWLVGFVFGGIIGGLAVMQMRGDNDDKDRKN